MKRFALRSRLCLLALILLGRQADVAACPFCSAVSQTFAEEMKAMDVVVFAEMTAAADAEPDENGYVTPSQFLVRKVLSGDAWLKTGETIEVHFFGTPSVGETYLVMATDPPKLMWGSPLKVHQRAQDYLLQVATLPDGPERLKFFMGYLEDEDELLARDAYDEFARTPYAGVLAVKDSMERAQLMRWIDDRDVPTTRRRLYLTMLGVCGNEQDAERLEQLMRSEKKEDRAGLNALVASYLSLRGEAGLPVVTELFLSNPDADYADIYAAIMAVRFHGNESDAISRAALLPGLRSVLEREDLADLVIPDLARWEDWSVIGRLVELFKDAKKESNWVRVPVVNYLRACPLPAAEAAIEQLSQIDPEAVERANTFFPYAQFEGEKRGGEATDTAAEVDGQGPTDPSPSVQDELAEDDQLANPGESLAQQERSEPASGGQNVWFYVVPIGLTLGLLFGSLLVRRNKQTPETTASH